MLFILRSVIRRLPGKVIRLVPLPAPETLSGPGSRSKAGTLCRKNGFEHVLLVTDRTLFSLGFHEKIIASLKEAGIRCSVFSDISSEPDLSIIQNGRKALSESGADAIIALGGGAVMDSCKMIAAGARLKGRSAASLVRKFLFVPGKTLPVIAIPTTAGTGAEITVGAVVTDAGHHKKCTVVIGLNVRGVILDGELTLNMPGGVTCACGIDALSHGLEGVTADVRSSEEDLQKSMECVRLVFQNLPLLIRDPGCVEARQNMLLAAHLGGNAINRQLAGYVHAFAHSIGAKYRLPHGNAIALSLLPVMNAQKEKCTDRLSALSRYCGFASASEDDGTAAEKLLCEIGRLIDLCGLEKKPLLIPKEDYRAVAGAVALDSINYSPPVVFSNKEIFSILDGINRQGGTDRVY